MTTNYRRGRDAEYRVLKDLEEKGYYVVRAAGSKGQADLVAGAAGKPTLAVQVKRDGKLFPGSWNDLFDWAQSAGYLPILASTPFRKPIEYFLLTDRREPRGHSPKEVFDPALPVEPKYVAETLAWCNARRKEQGKRPLNRLPKGNRHDSASCPCGAATGLFVNTTEALDAELTRFPLPRAVRTFVADFDSGFLPQYEGTP